MLRLEVLYCLPRRFLGRPGIEGWPTLDRAYDACLKLGVQVLESDVKLLSGGGWWTKYVDAGLLRTHMATSSNMCH